MSFCDTTIATYRSRLKTLLGIIAKAEAHPEGEALLNAKLADDMHPLATQIRFVANIPGEAMARLGSAEFSSSDDSPATFEEARAIVAATDALLAGIEASALPDPQAQMEFAIGDGAYHFAMSNEAYAREFSLPNFYFHLSIAYAILRMKGVELGKADFIPHMFAYMTKGPG